MNEFGPIKLAHHPVRLGWVPSLAQSCSVLPRGLLKPGSPSLPISNLAPGGSYTMVRCSRSTEMVWHVECSSTLAVDSVASLTIPM